MVLWLFLPPSPFRLHIDHHVFLAPPLDPWRRRCVDGAVNYILLVSQEDRTNVLLARTKKTQPWTLSNREICYQHQSDEKSQGDVSSVVRAAMEGEKLIFEKLTPVAELPDKSSPPVIASPAQHQPPIVESPAMQQLPCIQLTMLPHLSKNCQCRKVWLSCLNPLVISIMRCPLRRKLTSLYLKTT